MHKISFVKLLGERTALSTVGSSEAGPHSPHCVPSSEPSQLPRAGRPAPSAPLLPAALRVKAEGTGECWAVQLGDGSYRGANTVACSHSRRWIKGLGAAAGGRQCLHSSELSHTRHPSDLEYVENRSTSCSGGPGLMRPNPTVTCSRWQVWILACTPLGFTRTFQSRSVLRVGGTEAQASPAGSLPLKDTDGHGTTEQGPERAHGFCQEVHGSALRQL